MNRKSRFYGKKIDKNYLYLDKEEVSKKRSENKEAIGAKSIIYCFAETNLRA